MLSKSKLALIALIGMTLLGCGDDASDDGSPSNGSETNTGSETDCGGCEPGNFCDTDDGTCVPGCLETSDCAPEDICKQNTPMDDEGIGYCTNGEQDQRAFRECREALQVLADCGVITEDAAGYCTDDADAGGILYYYGGSDSIHGCILEWSDGVSCPETLPGCDLNELECGPSYPCPDGQSCDLSSELGRCR